MRDPEAITAWNLCCELVLHSRDRSLRVLDVNSKRASGEIFFEFLKAVDFPVSKCKF